MKTKTAIHTLVEFGNYQLMIAYHQVLLPEYPQGNEAAVAAEAANRQNKFWEYSNALFANQTKISSELYQQLADKLQLNLYV